MQENTTVNMDQPSNNSKPFVLLALVALAAIIGVGFIIARGRNAQPVTTETDTEIMVASPEVSPMVSPVASASPMGSATPATTTGQTDSKVKVFNVEAGSFYYKPNEIRVKKGDTVRIVMSSVSMMHDFNIDELGVKMPIVNNGKTGTVEFVADKVGKFEYYCSVGQHRKMGQVGTLIVE